MRALVRPSLAIAFCLLIGCAPAAQPPPTATANDTPRANPGPKTEADGRHRDLGGVKKGMDKLKEAIDAREQSVSHAMDVALGKADPMKTKKKTSAVELVTFLRAKKVNLSLGKGVHSRREKFMLDKEANKGEFNYGVGKNLPVEQRNQIMDKYDELEMHLEESHNAVEGSAQDLLDMNMIIMIAASSIYADRHKTGLELDDADYQIIADFIATQRRVEQIVAAAEGLMTTYHAVIKDKKDPKIIQKYVEEAQKGFPTTGTATIADGKTYVASLQKDAQGGKERYAQWVKDLHGEENFGSYKAGIDERFAKVEQQMATPMGSKQSAVASNGAPAPANGAAASTNTKDTVMRGASALARGDYAGAAGAATDLLPIDGRAKTAIKGVVALATGDYKGAVNAGLSMVPDGPIKKGLSLLSTLI